MIRKEQRFRHSSEVVKAAQDANCRVTETRKPDRGRQRTFWIDSPDEKEHVGIKEGEIGPATNIWLVNIFSKWGVIVLVAATLFLIGNYLGWF